MTFPFDGFTKQHAKSSPDMCASFPGEQVSEEEQAHMPWRKVSFGLEVKADRGQNPFSRTGGTHAKTAVQLARNGRNLMLANGALASFVVGIYSDIALVVRFDHASAIVSPCFNIREEPHLLQRFMWHFTHPLVGDSVVGCDPTVRSLDSDDREWVAQQLRDAGVANVDAELVEFHKGRRVEVPSGPNGATTPYINFRLLDVNGRLFSRATCVWRTIEDTRIRGPDGKLVDDPERTETPKVRIMKEAWRQLVRNSEATFYERLSSTIPENERVGLPRLVCGGDLGQLEVLEWEKTSPNARCMDGERDLRLPPEDSPSNSQGSSAGQASSPDTSTLPYPQHQTFSWTLGQDKAFTYRERSHMRFVIDDVGRPLTTAKNTKELVTALRDAIIGHKLAWTKAGVLHRDVSIGNVLLVDGNGEARFVGFLHDFDYSSMMDAPPQNTESEPEDGEVEADDLPFSEDPEDVDGLESGGAVVIAVDDLRKERTSELIGLVQGTFYFMATEILEERVVHHVRHDLESFHWVLLWAVIRHTAHSYSLKEAQGVFIFGEDQAAAGRKRLWFERDSRRFNIPGNKPLVKLLQDFGMLAYKSLGSLLVPPQYMTYDDVLKIFNDALDSPGWPKDDILWEEAQDYPFRRCWKLECASEGYSVGDRGFVRNDPTSHSVGRCWLIPWNDPGGSPD
ncbi:hypothetical protein C8Q76DRAFT_771081 [Earliella scabrosa]|nr:hypothetical protein C8Q76DRAFT_771081 [Earliella scabrosa]